MQTMNEWSQLRMDMYMSLHNYRNDIRWSPKDRIALAKLQDNMSRKTINIIDRCKLPNEELGHSLFLGHNRNQGRNVTAGANESQNSTLKWRLLTHNPE